MEPRRCEAEAVDVHRACVHSLASVLPAPRAPAVRTWAELTAFDGMPSVSYSHVVPPGLWPSASEHGLFQPSWAPGSATVWRTDALLPVIVHSTTVTGIAVPFGCDPAA